MKTSYILIGLAAVVVLFLLLSKSTSLTNKGTTYTGGAAYIGATGNLLAGGAKVIDALDLGSGDSSTGDS